MWQCELPRKNVASDLRADVLHRKLSNAGRFTRCVALGVSDTDQDHVDTHTHTHTHTQKVVAFLPASSRRTQHASPDAFRVTLTLTLHWDAAHHAPTVTPPSPHPSAQRVFISPGRIPLHLEPKCLQQNKDSISAAAQKLLICGSEKHGSSETWKVFLLWPCCCLVDPFPGGGLPHLDHAMFPS